MLIQCDASALEWRVAVELSKDPIGIQEIVEGQDVHSNNQSAFDLPSRLIAKIFLFRTIYRGSGYAFANDPDFMHVSASQKFWDGMNEKFYAKYKGLDAKHKEWMRIVAMGKPIEGPMRDWFIPMGVNYKGESKLPINALTNYPVQGTGADVMMIARISAYRRIKAMEIPCDFISTVHDSIVLDTEEKYLEQLKKIFDDVFADIPANIKKLFGYDWTVPMACESKYGPNMKDMHKFK